MKREDIIKLFPDATDEQINAILNQHHADAGKEFAKTASLQAEVNRLKPFETKAGELETANMTAEQKAQRAIDEANIEKAKFQQQTNRLAIEKLFVAAGYTEDKYSKFLDDIVTEDLERSKRIAEAHIGMAASERDAAKAATVAELTRQMPRPGAGAPGGEEKTDGEKMAVAAANRGNADTKKIMDNYL